MKSMEFLQLVPVTTMSHGFTSRKLSHSWQLKNDKKPTTDQLNVFIKPPQQLTRFGVEISEMLVIVEISDSPQARESLV